MFRNGVLLCSASQFVNKIETIFDDKRGRKRVKNQGVVVLGKMTMMSHNL